MKKSPALPLALMALLLLGAGCKENPTEAACETVQGRVEGVSAPVFDGEALTGFRVEKASVSGDMTGSSSADFTITRFGEDGTLFLAGAHTFWDGADAFLFRTTDEGLTTADGQVQNEMQIVEGATGRLSTVGTVDLQTGALTLDYTGEVCR
ncbi:MAG: hypothetical protein R3247_13525 [Rhodothermales bacterium]|nr:hypothetical protein [Rhodothermales bacterium]